jgi:uncharacterized membrane protein
MKLGRRAPWLAVLLAVLAIFATLALPALAVAGPRSGGSFGGRSGFRSSGGGFSSSGGGFSNGGYGRSYGGGYSGGGSHFFFLPGGGYGGYGYGGGLGLFGGLIVMVIAGVAVVSVMRAVRRGSGNYAQSAWSPGSYDDGYAPVAMSGNAYLYRLQLALGRSGRGVQERLSEFAEKGDTSSEAGLAALLQQSALELLREKDAVRYVGADGHGPMSLTNAETSMNSLSLAERSRFQVERVRAADGRVNRATAVAEEGKEALELVVVTFVVATRAPLANFKEVATLTDLTALLSELGSVSPEGLLGLEVVWTPADPDDSMTETDVMTTYPDLRGI